MKKLVLHVCAAALLACGCASTSDSPYRDPCEVRGTTTDFTAYDFQQCAVAMVDSMLANATFDRKLKSQFAGKVPVVAVLPPENRTYRIFDLRSMAQTVESRLVNSGKFNFIDRKGERALLAEKLKDADGALTSGSPQTGFGNAAVADYLLTSELNEIRDTYGNTRESYYKLTMKLTNKRTGLVDWSGEKEIRKVGTRPSVGW